MMLAAMMKEVPRPAAASTSSTPQEHRGCNHSRDSAKDHKGSTTVAIRRFLCMFSPKHSSKQQQQLQEEEGQAAAPPTSNATASPGAFAGSRQCGLQRVFDYFDENGDGKISPSELQKCMKAGGEELSSEEAEAVVESTDSDGDGLLGLEDFVKLVEGEGEGEEERARHLMDAFRMYATEEEGRGGGGEGGGRITPKSLRRMLRRLGDSRTNDECAAMIRRFDINGDGVLSFDEFKIMML